MIARLVVRQRLHHIDHHHREIDQPIFKSLRYHPKKENENLANLRISLGVEVRPGKEHAAAKGLPGLWRTLEKLPRHR